MSALHWLDAARACKYIPVEEHCMLLEKCRGIGRMLGEMMSESEAEKFCRRFE